MAAGSDNKTPAHVKFLSLEPLLGPLPRLNLTGIDWAIVGGESGPGARPMDPNWVTDIRDRCLNAGVAFFFKQWGGVNKKRTGRELDGRTWDQMPGAEKAVSVVDCKVDHGQEMRRDRCKDALATPTEAWNAFSD